jgi:hypothetical protein
MDRFVLERFSRNTGRWCQRVKRPPVALADFLGEPRVPSEEFIKTTWLGTLMNIPAHFEFHYVQNGVKKSVTLVTALLFQTHTPGQAARTHNTSRPDSQQREAR